MDPGGIARRRRLLTAGVLAALVTTIVPVGATADARDPASTPATAPRGEAGSGPAPLPIVVPDRPSARAASFGWADLDGSDAWAKQAIDFVGKAHDWMRDFAPKPDGKVPFRPDMIQTRKYLARAMVKAFARGAEVDPSITFADLDPSQSFYQWANIAVQRGWITPTSDGRFQPDRPVTTGVLHAVLVQALGLRPIARQLDGLRTRDGVTIATPHRFGALLLGMRLGLRFNSTNESMDVGPRTPLTRAQVAYSLFKAKTLPDWTTDWLADQYDGVVLPKLGPRLLDVVRWGVRAIGYPYVWGGEWGIGGKGQPVPGFDCSGLVWWLLRRNDGGAWTVHPPRPYAGWELGQRTSADMARYGSLTYGRLQPGDLMFFDGNGDDTIDHVNVYIGNGYALDSSNSIGGVSIMWVGSGWYRDHFSHGRRVLPSR